MEITKNVPIPDQKRAGAKRVYPFHEMTPADSLSVTGLGAFEKARRAAAMHASKNDQIFTSRKGFKIVKRGDDYKCIRDPNCGVIWRTE